MPTVDDKREARDAHMRRSARACRHGPVRSASMALTGPHSKAYIVMADIVVACIVMAYMYYALLSCGLHSYGSDGSAQPVSISQECRSLYILIINNRELIIEN